MGAWTARPHPAASPQDAIDVYLRMRVCVLDCWSRHGRREPPWRHVHSPSVAPGCLYLYIW